MCRFKEEKKILKDKHKDYCKRFKNTTYNKRQTIKS